MFSNLLKGRSLASAEAVSSSDSLAVSIFERLFNSMDSILNARDSLSADRGAESTQPPARQPLWTMRQSTVGTLISDMSNLSRHSVW